MRKALLIGAMMAVGLTAGCEGQTSSSAVSSEFNKERAWADLLAQCEFGPRVPGTQGHRDCLAWMEEQFAAAGWHTERNVFAGRLALNGEYHEDLTNLVVTKTAEASPSIALSAHWDTRAFADFDPNPLVRDQPVLGANDAGSGVAVLLELARNFSDHPQAGEITFLLWDAEDQGVQRRNETWCLGARHFAAYELDARGWELEYGVNVDMVADDELQLKREARSHAMARAWTDRIWRLGQERYPDVYLDEQREVLDDHVPFLVRGIDYIDIIDIEYPEWHTISDTPDACSADSLATVGEVLLQVISEVLSEKYAGERPQAGF